MGFYPPATLLRDGERRGVEIRPPDVNLSLRHLLGRGPAARRSGSGSATSRASAPGLSCWSPSATERRASPTWATWCAARRLHTDLLEALVRAGACDGFGDRRRLLWELRLHRAPAGPARARQLALALDASPTPALRPMSDWERMVADHETMSLTTGPHPMALLRPRSPEEIRTGRIAARRHRAAR